MNQLGLPFSNKIQYTAQNFIVSPSNDMAFQWLQQWPKWPSHTILIIGSAKSGKTHLANIWQEKSDAHWVPINILKTDNLELLNQYLLNLPNNKYLFICENIDLFINNFPQPLLHLYNFVKEHQGYLLCTSSKLPHQWMIKLKDLESRLKSSPALTIEMPDDQLRRGIIFKRLADLQLKAPLSFIEYIINHTDRSYEDIDHIINLINLNIEKFKVNLSIPLIKKLLSI